LWSAGVFLCAFLCGSFEGRGLSGKHHFYGSFRPEVKHFHYFSVVHLSIGIHGDCSEGVGGRYALYEKHERVGGYGHGCFGVGCGYIICPFGVDEYTCRGFDRCLLRALRQVDVEGRGEYEGRRSRNTTSVIEAMENVASISCCRLSAMRGVSVFACRLVEQVHEVHGAGFEAVHDFIDAGYKEVVGEERHDTHYEACNGGDEGGVDAVGKRVDSR